MSLEETFGKLAIDGGDGAIAVKSLVFKPKTPKGQTPVPVVVVALQTTGTPSGVIASVSGTKDPRLARDELFQSHFKIGNAKEFHLGHLAQAEGEFKLLLDDKLVALEDDAILQLNEEKFVSKGGLVKDYLKSFDPVEVDFSQVIEAKPKEAAKPKSKSKEKDASAAALEDAKLIGITVDKALDFSGWYQQILTKGEMLDYYDVSGCYILRPASYAIWEQIQRWFDDKIKGLGVQNAYFPMFVSSRVLEKEKDHIEGFAPEVAWVTKAGSSELDEPIAIRPTSETVMYPYYAKWVQSYRDLPIKLNQWNSVVRWEFKHPQPFLRTREFLWQEGHTAHLTKEEAEEEVMQILDFYAGVYEELLAVPVVKGRKTEKEKFAGGDFTTTCEGYIPQTGRGIQGATSHHLGQNFSKMFNISVENPLGSEHPKIYAYQNSWGLSTRVIGVMVMIHSDNKGLVIPPRVSQFQSVIVPVGITAKTSDEQRAKIHESAKDVESRLRKAGIRVFGDYNDNYTPGWKFAQYELKGIPLRIEMGPKDLEKQQVTCVRRNDGKKVVVSLDELEKRIPEVLEELQQDLFNRAKELFDSHRVIVDEWKGFVPALNKKNVILAPWCGVEECEEDIKASSAKKDDGEEFEVDDKSPSMGAKSLCIPFQQPPLKSGQKCVKCDREAKQYCMFGRSY
ncbi:putative prolyl-tRNA synthetase YHR020W [Kluyveromyces marxianus]|uniref:proline--tRNA ligase n=1 Tax=Kluyveromyces marxianus TaxID=4911 RepID=A0ABX6ENH0_KLUMA|nr:putative prolyl-tRNA synthetase YHR020W [Kluyveromyces marxianus]BAP69629.1 putative prolyl-tRNA synthetase YHR020W [Kluyveromyces marxianus]